MDENHKEGRGDFFFFFDFKELGKNTAVATRGESLFSSILLSLFFIPSLFTQVTLRKSIAPAKRAREATEPQWGICTSGGKKGDMTCRFCP